jgi:hypothetical protein
MEPLFTRDPATVWMGEKADAERLLPEAGQRPDFV